VKVAYQKKACYSGTHRHLHCRTTTTCKSHRSWRTPHEIRHKAMHFAAGTRL